MQCGQCKEYLTTNVSRGCEQCPPYLVLCVQCLPLSASFGLGVGGKLGGLLLGLLPKLGSLLLGLLAKLIEW
jgi:hypothetical protein